jgi:hypothetical protein
VWTELTLLAIRAFGQLPGERLPEWLWFIESIALWMTSIVEERQGLAQPQLASIVDAFPLESARSPDERLLLMRYLASISPALLLRILSEYRRGDHWSETLERTLNNPVVASLYLERSTSRHIGTIIPGDSRIGRAFERPVKTITLPSDAKNFRQVDKIDNLSPAHYSVICPPEVKFVWIKLISDPCITARLSIELKHDEENMYLDEGESPEDEAQSTIVEHGFHRVNADWITHRIDVSLTTGILSLTLVNKACRGVWEKPFELEFTWV